MLAARSEDQEGFGFGCDWFTSAIQQDRADLFGERGSAWFSGLHGDVSRAPEKLAEEPGLGRLAAPFNALERNE
jgi:hypothetical protein